MLNNTGVYKLLLVLHLMSAIVGFGAVVLNGVYGQWAKRHPGAEGFGAAAANHHVSLKWGEKFIYAVPVFGILLVLASNDNAKFGQTWIWASLTLYVAALGASHGVLIPNSRRIVELMGELAVAGPPRPGPGASAGPPPQVVELERRGKLQAAVGATLNVVLVAIVSLMVWKPGL